MRDLALILVLVGLVYATLLRPWLGVLALAVVAVLHPQGYATGAVAHWPFFKILVGTLLVSTLLSPRTRSAAFLRSRLRLFADWRIVLIGVLWLTFLNSTAQSLIPTVAWPKFLEITKVLVASLFALLLLDSRRKVEWFLFAVALSVALVAFKGGYWAVMTGSVDRVYGPPGSQFYDNNHFAVLAIMSLPLLALLFKRVESHALRSLVAVLVGATLVAVLTSWSRGALLSLGATMSLLLLFADRRLALLSLLVVVAVFSFGLLPDAWFSRMETISSYRSDGSAAGRLEVWRQGVDFAVRHPLTGAGPNGWLWVAGRDWHSAYVEIVAEHGFLSLGLWVALLIGTLASLARCAVGAEPALGAPCAAIFISLVGYAVGAAFLGLAYWNIYYQLVVVAVLLTGPGPRPLPLQGRGD